MKVIGTAGHIDHGKSTLVKRLTGTDPDRLAEEKARGMTIDLGFAWMRLPSGDVVSIVDVPGHERFVRNMLAGAAGIDVALLVVAADELVMPQTREHLAILDLLGVASGVVVLTKADAVEDEWLELGREDIAALLAGTRLEGSAIVPVDSFSGRGVDDLVAALDAAVGRAAERADRGLPFLPVDRVFTLPGFGTVVTGTLHGGRLEAGQEVAVLPSRRRGRIRGLQTHSNAVSSAPTGARVAVNLAGIGRDEIRRGDMLALPDTVHVTRAFDAHLRVLPSSPRTMESGLEVSVHVGAAERPAVLRVAAGGLEPGQAGWVQVRLREPVAAVRGQHFIVRLPAPAGTVGGGEVVDVTPRLRRHTGTEARFQALHGGSLQEAILALLDTPRPRSLSHLAPALGESGARVQAVLDGLVRTGAAVRVADGYLSAASWDAVAQRVAGLVGAFHEAQPLRPGMPREELRRRLGWSAGQWPAALRLLAEGGTVREEGASVAVPDFRGGTSSREEDVQRLSEVLARAPFSPPTGADLLNEAGVNNDLLAALVGEGKLVRVGEGLYLTPDSFREATNLIVDRIRREGQVTVSEVRDALGTSRKYALALLDSLDARRVTRRDGDVRVLGSRAPA